MKQNNHVGILIPRTPTSLRKPLREKLWKISLDSILNQQYDNWTAIIIGEKEPVADSRVLFIEIDMAKKGEKLNAAIEYIAAGRQRFDYIIRMDDDDIISETALQRFAHTDADCIYDQYHAFWEVFSGKLSIQKRAWMANTVMHKTGHALFEMTEYDKPCYLLNSDHSESWHKYYRGRQIISSPQYEPLYVRILSPFTVTAGVNKQDDVYRQYIEYLSHFGDWAEKKSRIKGFERSFKQLEALQDSSFEWSLPASRKPALGLSAVKKLITRIFPHS